MGDEFRLARPEPIAVKAQGTRPIARVDIIKDARVIYTAEPKKRNIDFVYADKDAVAGRHYYYVRLMQEDGMVAWSSPLFVNW